VLAPRLRPLPPGPFPRPAPRPRRLPALLQPRTRTHRPPHPRPHPGRHRLRCPQDESEMSRTRRHISEAVQVRARAPGRRALARSARRAGARSGGA
jgi:hypothetical protein